MLITPLSFDEKTEVYKSHETVPVTMLYVLLAGHPAGFVICSVGPFSWSTTDSTVTQLGSANWVVGPVRCFTVPTVPSPSWFG